MLRVAWWLGVAWAVHEATSTALWILGLYPTNRILCGLLFYGVQYGVVAAYARRYLGASWAELTLPRGIPGWLVIPVTCSVVGELLLNIQSIAICESLNVFSPETIGLPGDGSDGTVPSYDAPLVEGLVSRALLPAVFEEAVFRGLVLTALAATMSKRRAIVISALCFAVMHLRIERMPDTFLMGILWGWMFVRTGSLLPGMLAHFLNNAACEVLGRIDVIPWLPAEWLEFDRYGLLPTGTVWAGAALLAASVLVIRMGRGNLARSRAVA